MQPRRDEIVHLPRINSGQSASFHHYSLPPSPHARYSPSKRHHEDPLLPRGHPDERHWSNGGLTDRLGSPQSTGRLSTGRPWDPGFTGLASNPFHQSDRRFSLNDHPTNHPRQATGPMWSTAFSGNNSYSMTGPRSTSVSYPQSHRSSPEKPILTPVSGGASGTTQSFTDTANMPTDTTLASSAQPSPDDSFKGPGTADSNEDSNQKLKKRRVALSCAECAKRKQKCNRETPCQHCTARRVPELCVPYVRQDSPPLRKAMLDANEGPERVSFAKATFRPDRRASVHSERISVGTYDDHAPARSRVGSTPARRTCIKSIPGAAKEHGSSALPTLTVRVSRVEAMLNAVLNRVDGLEGTAMDTWRINHAPASTPPPLMGMNRNNTSSRGSRAASHTSRYSEERAAAPAADGDVAVFTIDKESSVRNPFPQSMARANFIADPELIPLDDLQASFALNGLDLEDMVRCKSKLPPWKLAKPLVDWFFDKINPLRYPIDEIAFRKGFDGLYASPAADSHALIILPVVFVALALAARVAPSDLIAEEEEKKSYSLQMFGASKVAAQLAAAVKSESIQLVETYLLTGLFHVLMHDRRLSEGWLAFRKAITMGQAIGLDRDGTQTGRGPYETEYQRWLWAYLIHADATYSCLLNRPICIYEDTHDTQQVLSALSKIRIPKTLIFISEPANLDLKELVGVKAYRPPRPLSEPTFATYSVLRRRLGDLVSKVTQCFQRVRGHMHYTDVKAFDKEFKELMEDLPPHYQMEEPDRSYDQHLPFLVVHRYYIQTEILHFIIILHRPWLLRQLGTSHYATSRDACFQAAVLDHRIRQAFKRDCPDFLETLLGGSFREFNVAMIAGISIIIDPYGPHAKYMKGIVKQFLELFTFDTNADDFSQKEVAVIRLLNQRAESVDRKCQVQRRVPARPQDNVSDERGLPQRPSCYSLPNGQTLSDHSNNRPHYSRSLDKHGASSSDGPTFHYSSNSQLPQPSKPIQSDDYSQLMLNRWIQANNNVGSWLPAPVTSEVPGGFAFPMFDPNGWQVHAPGPGFAPAFQNDAVNPVGTGHAETLFGLDGNNQLFWNELVDCMQNAVRQQDPSVG